MPLKLLVVASETPDEADERRRTAGASSDETYRQTVSALAPDAAIETVSCLGGGAAADGLDLAAFDGAFFAGSPIAMHQDNAATRAAADFMTRVFSVGLSAFGSCAGLQIAAVAAGGRVETRSPSMKAGFTRGIVATTEGRDHFLLAGRPLVWDAPAMHADVIAQMPPGGTVLARSKHTPVEAAEIRHGAGVFHGVQYHPEIAIDEIAAAILRQSTSLVEEGLARGEDDIRAYAAMLTDLADDPQRHDIAWRLGLDADVFEPARRMTEIRNSLAHLAARRP
ncbi:glutamine amidotransferase-related protein [Fulvimarina endophytica]|uniref:glutamine amidotransferase-related protein n=1 Tax=Fulvimarina endophytica TaxID=2293836 RepID=UPI001314A108|nr:gamma-glutamyl-gamma-aminobutyrate hydrolase family protein [Fulvimarina endophytica]